MAKLLALVERHLGKSWVEISEWLRERNSLDAIEQRLLAYDFEGVIAEVESAAAKFAADTQAEWARAGRSASKWLDDQLPDRMVRFDLTNQHAVRAAERNTLELVQGLTDETRTVIRRVIVTGQRAGLNPRSIARDLRDSLTLTEQQAIWVSNYRRALQEGNFANAMGRQLHDRRSNGMLRRVASEGGSLTENQVDDLVERYRLRQIASRAVTVARTESQRNVETGVQEAFDQAVGRGDIEAEQIVSEWIPGPDTDNARPFHREAALLDQRPKHGEDFVMSDGVRMKHPGDQRGGAKHNAGCRCTTARTLEAA